MALHDLLEHPLAARLTLTLLHFLWQGTLIGVVAAGLLTKVEKSRPASRYAVLFTLFSAMLICPVATFLLLPRELVAVEQEVADIPDKFDDRAKSPTKSELDGDQLDFAPLQPDAENEISSLTFAEPPRKTSPVERRSTAKQKACSLSRGTR